MYRISNLIMTSHPIRYEKNTNKSKNDTNKFQSILEDLNEDRISNEEYIESLKKNMYIIDEDKLFPLREDYKNGGPYIHAVYTPERIRKDYEFLVSSRPTTFTFDKDGNIVIPISNKIGPDYNNRLLPGKESMIGFNEMIVETGSRIDLGDGYSINVLEDSIKYCYKDRVISQDDLMYGEHKEFFEDMDGVALYVNLMRHYANGDISSMWLGLGDVKQNSKKYLERIGIDVTKDFTINGTLFRYVEHSNNKGTTLKVV